MAQESEKPENDAPERWDLLDSEDSGCWTASEDENGSEPAAVASEAQTSGPAADA